MICNFHIITDIIDMIIDIIKPIDIIHIITDIIDMSIDILYIYIYY